MLCKLILFGDVEHMLLSHCILFSLRLINNVVFPKVPFFCVCFSSRLPSCTVTTPFLQPPSTPPFLFRVQLLSQWKECFLLCNKMPTFVSCLPKPRYYTSLFSIQQRLKLPLERLQMVNIKYTSLIVCCQCPYICFDMVSQKEIMLFGCFPFQLGLHQFIT